MNRIVCNVSLALVGLVAVAFLGCGGDQVKENKRPAWIDQGSAAFKDKAVYGVGAAGNISSISLRRSTADAQARAELAKIFSSRVQNLIKNYEASTNDGEREAAEAHRQEATKVFTEMELSGVDIKDRYFDGGENVQYSLARLDMEAFDAQLDKMAKLNARTKQVIRANAERAFEEIDEESEKRKAE